MYPYHSAPPRETTLGVVTVYPYERGLLYRAGAFERVLGPGRYRLWPFARRRVAVVDVRRAAVAVHGQRLLTADQIAVTVNLTVGYEVADPAAAVHTVADYRGQLYEDAQLAARTLVGAKPVDALLAERAQLNEQLLAALRPPAAGYGLAVVQAGLKDVILAPRVRDLLMKEAETKRLAQAALLAAREEVATLRALANAARLAADHPHLLALRELDALRSFSQTPGNTVVVGLNGVTPVRVAGNGKPRPTPPAEPPEEE